MNLSELDEMSHLLYYLGENSINVIYQSNCMGIVPVKQMTAPILSIGAHSFAHKTLHCTRIHRQKSLHMCMCGYFQRF